MPKLTGQDLNKNMDLYRIIAKNIKHLRSELELTQVQLAIIVGIPKESWCHIEKGRTRIEYGLMLAIANLFHLPSVECLSSPEYYKLANGAWKEQVLKSLSSQDLSDR